jgi:hypothetical protein
VIAAGASLYLWFYAGSGRIELPRLTVIGILALALGCVYWSIRALASRRGREAIAFRKMLTAGRAYFIDELQKDEPALRDEWYPWLLAFELTKQMDAWSTARPDSGSRARSRSGSVSSSPSTTDSGGTWTGFGGGRSGGAGGGASWQTAVSGMAAGVSAPSSGGSSRGSGGGGSSSGGSSGGGGGGGW